MAIEQQSNVLSWKGYTVKKRYNQDAWSEPYAFPARHFEDIPYCIESYDKIRQMSSEERIALQRNYFERTDQSVMGNIFMGLVRPAEAKGIRTQLSLCISTLMRLMQVMAKEDLNGPEFEKIFKSISPAAALHLRSSLASSIHYYANDCGSDLFQKILDHPFYLELGTDILCNKTELLLSEFQVRYATPYPHLLTNMCQAYEELLPDMFKKFGLKIDRFEEKRNTTMKRAMEKFASLKEDSNPVPVLLDAWAYMQNSGANWIGLAREFQMNYILFDDLVKGRNFYETAYQNGRLSFFNQPALSLVDPAHRAWRRSNAEQIEIYDELAWNGLTERYLQGDVFFANSPLSDIANDKAYYPALSELCRYFFAEELSLPIMQCKRCWSDNDFTKPDQDVIFSIKTSKDKYVLAHRYLEGGLGIKVGKLIDQVTWDAFIDRYVIPRPYLFVARLYFNMEVDFAMRILSTGYQDSISDLETAPEVFVADTFYARFTTTSPIMADNHRTILLFEPDPSAPEPRYKLET